MSQLVQRLSSEGKIHCPRWMPSNIQYLTVMGSTAYGSSTDKSDVDYYGWCIEPKEYIFPHTVGLIPGFDNIEKFGVYQEHHIKDGHCSLDFQIFGIIKYMALLMDCNPNILDSIFTPIDCVQTCSRIGQMLRDARKSFLHKGVYHRYRCYSYSQLHKIDSTGQKSGKRQEIRDQFGWDVKFGTHVVRLLLECEQILTDGDLDLRRNSDMLRAIRNGEWSKERVKEFFETKERHLEELYHSSKLPYSCDRGQIKVLLLNILEEHYGSLSQIIRQESKAEQQIAEIKRILNI